MWGTIAFEDPEEVSFTLSELEVRIIHKDDSYRIHLDGNLLKNRVGISSGWNEVHIPPSSALSLEPATPDLPIVLRPQEPIALAPGAEISYRVQLPLWVRLVAVPGRNRKGSERDILFDLPAQTLKRTWFGTGESGEIGYSWRFLPRSTERYQKHLFCVPLIIRNSSQTVLWFERLLLRVIHLDLYRVARQIETNRVTVSFKGSEQLSQVTFEPPASAAQRGAKLLSEHRETANQDIIRRSFLWLRDLTT
ncbi:MAG: hypothetical protein WD492_04600 [Alkalispirochaeta sp.]